MSDALNITIRDLPPTRVALLEYDAGGLTGEYSESIGMLFREVEAWLLSRGYDAAGLRRIGVPFNDGPTLRRYWCCIEAPAGLEAGEGVVQVRELAAGRYAVLSLVKDSNTIGDSIGRFYSEYAPVAGLVLDHTRPPLEIYAADTMDYCAPIR